jgi:hypothetical protein
MLSIPRDSHFFPRGAMRSVIVGLLSLLRVGEARTRPVPKVTVTGFSGSSGRHLSHAKSLATDALLRSVYEIF